MNLILETSGYRRNRGSVLATVRVKTDEDGLIFADSVNLSTVKGRSQFIRALESQLNGTRPGDGVLERQLLSCLEEAERELATDPAPSAPCAAEGEIRIDGYARWGGRFDYVQVKMTVAGPIETRIPLTTFDAEVVEDLTLDDGAETRRYFVIAGAAGEQPLPTVRVPAEDFGDLAWVLERWGVRPRVLPGPGRKDLVRDAIQAHSSGARLRTVLGHTGWHWVNGRLVFLHGGGGIGADGVVEDIEVELEGKLAHYRLPAPPMGAGLVEAVRTSWDLWSVAEPEAGAPLLGAAYGAPLAECLRPDFTLWLRGRTGLLKTSFATLILCHFGAFDFKRLPANWEATANSLEKQAFLIKDAPFLIDDFRPPADRYEASEMRRKAARLIRAAGNLSGRGRMRADTTLRPEYYPRGIVIVTAEERAPGESTAARVAEITFQDGTVDLERLTHAQQHTDLLPGAMAAHSQWLAGKLEEGAGWLHELHQKALGQACGVGGHLRHAQTLAYLLTGWSVFAEFAQTVGAISAVEADERLREVDAALRQVAAQQAEVARDVRPDLVFVQTFGDLLAGGKAHLAAIEGGAPSDPEPWGWTYIPASGEAQEAWRPQGDKLGWVDDDLLYLIPSAAHRLVAIDLQETFSKIRPPPLLVEGRRITEHYLTIYKAVAERGEQFLVSPQMLYEALERGEFLLPGNKGRRHNQQVEGVVRETIRLRRAVVLAAWAGETA